MAESSRRVCKRIVITIAALIAAGAAMGPKIEPMFRLLKTWAGSLRSVSTPPIPAQSAPIPTGQPDTKPNGTVTSALPSTPNSAPVSLPPPTTKPQQPATSEKPPFTIEQLVGSWRGGRHLTDFRADGTFLLDPDIVPDPASGVWKLEGVRLTQTFREGNSLLLDIVFIAGRVMVARDPATGKEFNYHREAVAFLNPDSLKTGDISGDEFLAKGLRMRAFKGQLFVYDAVAPMVLPGLRKKVIMTGGDRVTKVAFEFDPPVRSFSLTLPALTGGASFPTFKMTAFNRAGVGYDVIGQEHWIPAKPTTNTITMNSGEIARIELDVDNRFGNTAWATYSCLPIMDMKLER